MLERLQRLRRDLHQIPELDFDLPETTRYVRRVLEMLPCEVFSPDGHGLCAWFDAGKTEAVAFRSDMDALPICEVTGVPFASKHAGKMHACGHDGHMAMVLELAHQIAAVKDRLTKNVLLVFQPAEETTGGARLICESGVFGERNVKAIYGFHLWPDLPMGAVATRPGPLLARANEITVDFEGRSTHIAKSEDGADALLAAAKFVVQADLMLAGLRAEEGPWCTLKFGKLTSGTVRNAIAAHGHLEGSLRVFSDAAYEKAWARLHEIAGEISTELGVKITITGSAGYPPVINDAALFEDARRRIPELEVLEKPLLIAEDFAFYQKTLPGLFMLLGTGTGIPLHSDRFNFDEAVLERGVEIYKRLLPVS
ncbi:amidohydrolase [Sutterella sp.]|uniref:amidohydrolase n=1 Tax=Sutterella sp. TaxID=1981025 RepID=UPI003FD77EC1